MKFYVYQFVTMFSGIYLNLKLGKFVQLELV